MTKEDLGTRVRTLTKKFLYQSGLEGGIKDRVFSLVPSLPDELVSAYYKGLKERINKEQSPFEKAFLLLANYVGFMPRPSIRQMPGYSIIYQEEHRDIIIKNEGLVRGHEIYCQRQAVNGIDTPRGILNLAAAYVLHELDKRHRKQKADDNATIIRNFKLYIDEVVDRLQQKKVSKFWPESEGKLRFLDNPKGFSKIVKAAGNPIELLESVSQNAAKFVSRYAALHGYRIRTDKTSY